MQNANLSSQTNVHLGIRFFAELNDFLPAQQKFTCFDVVSPQHNTVKHLVESLGVPHTEIDLLTVNGQSVDFNFIPKNGDLICVYPVFESLDITPIIHLRPKPLREIRFVLDAHLGKLAVYLRMMGFDTLYSVDYTDDELAACSAQERRVLLTRDRGLLKRKQVTHAHYVHSTFPRQQIIEVLRQFDLCNQIAPFKRCLACNHCLQKAEKNAILDRLPANTARYYDEFMTCPGCQRVYWKGNHFLAMQRFVDEMIYKCENESGKESN